MDIKGYSGPGEFARNFPFVPYQFIIMQNVFSEIRKHGNSGKHLSGGERSMLSGFQEAAQKIGNKDEYALAPFYLFYDTVHTFLDSSIRRVIERCQKAADTNAGIEQQDVAVLKLLYLSGIIFCDTKKFSRIFRGNRIILVSIVSHASLTAVSRTDAPGNVFQLSKAS